VKFCKHYNFPLKLNLRLQTAITTRDYRAVSILHNFAVTFSVSIAHENSYTNACYSFQNKLLKNSQRAYPCYERCITYTALSIYTSQYALFQFEHCFRPFDVCYCGVNTFFRRIFEQIIFCAKEIPFKIFFTLTKTGVHSVTVWFNYFRRCFVSHCLTAGCQLCQINKLFAGLTITHEDKAQCTRHPIKSVISRA
jgi:hypothetical protein